MKKTILLKIFVDIIYYLGIITIVTVPISAVVLLTQVYGDGFKHNGRIYVGVDVITVFNVVIQYFFWLLLFYCLFLFRKVIPLFIDLNFFHIKVIKLLSKIGKLLLVFGIGEVLISFIPLSVTYLTLTENSFTLHDDFITEWSFSYTFFLWMVIGLFFMILSEVFKIAKKAKQENELTI